MNSNAAQIGLAVATINAIILVLLLVGALPAGTTMVGRVLLSIEAPILGSIELLVRVLDQGSAAYAVIIIMIVVGSGVYGLIAAGICRLVERFKR